MSNVKSSKSKLLFRFSKLICLINEYNVFLSNSLNNEFKLLCDSDYLYLILNILKDKDNTYDYDYYRFFIEKDIETINSLIYSKKLVKLK